MAIVAGVDFGTLSVRVSIVDSEKGMLASAVAEYPLHRKREDPELATQSHEDHMRALVSATRDIRSRRNHRNGSPRKSRSHSLVRRRLFFRVGIRQTPPLAPPQSSEAQPVRQRV